MTKLIFVAGLEKDKTTAQQAELVKKGFPEAEVISLKYDTSDANVISAIDKNPDAEIILFSAGCTKAKTAATQLKKNNRDLNSLHINEPFTSSKNTLDTVNAAIKLGVPSSNVYSGPNPDVGSNIVGSTKLSGRLSHFQSLTILATLIAKKAPAEPKTTTHKYTAKYISAGVMNSGIPTQLTFEVYRDETLFKKYENSSSFSFEEKNKQVYIVAKDYFFDTQGKWIGTSAELAETDKIQIEGYPFPAEVVTAPPTSIVIKPDEPKNFSGKITLKVKSGPGVLIGDTERVITNNKVELSGLQFDKPGDYVISIVPDSPDIDPAEIAIKVLPEPEIVPQEESRGTDKPADISGTRPIIAQIDKPTVDLPPMEYERPKNMQDTALVANGIGVTPFVNYMGSPINDRDIQILKLYHNGIVPKMSIMFYDSTNLMKDVGMPQDDTKIELFLNARTPNLKSIHLKFKIESFKDIGSNLYSIEGTLDISELYRIKYKSYTGTSFQVLRDICREIKLGFNSNIQNTDDSMPWRVNGSKLYEFIEHIVERSYISDNSFMIGYIDYYYCFNYVDIEKEMTRNNTSDIGIETGNFDSTDDDSKKISKLILTNEKSFSKSCFYFESDKKIVNNSTNISLTKGNSRKTISYDKENKTFLIFNIDATTTDESKSIILKGARGDEEAFKNNYTTKYIGKIDTDNVHKNYDYSYIQNRINLDELTKIEMMIKLPSPNYNLYKFQKVNVQVVNAVPTPTDNTAVEWRLSGDWAIHDINYNFVGGMISQDIKLVRKELGKNLDEMNENLVKEKKKETKEQNENPAPKEALPNSVYAAGEIYTVQDKSGKKYTLTVKSLSEDGKEVSANIKEI